MVSKKLISIILCNAINLSILSSDTVQKQENQPASDSSSTYELRYAIIQHIINSPDFSDTMKKESIRTFLPDQSGSRESKN